MMESTAVRDAITHILCCNCAMCFSAAASSEKFHGSMNLASNTAPESTDGKTTMPLATASAIRRALENAGVELIEENGGGLGARLKESLELIDKNRDGSGVRLRKPSTDKSRK